MITSKLCSQISMETTIFLLLLASFITQSHTHPLQFASTDSNQSFISIRISKQGLDFLKDLLVTKAISSMTPLQLPTIQKNARIPFLGSVHMELSNITIYHIDVPSSIIQPGDDGVTIIASGTYCNLSMDWYYSYSTWVMPVEISDRGHASIQVEGMEVGLTLGLENQNGTLKLSLMNCGCNVKDISIKLDGGASWLYQGMINAFEEQIGSAVESAITKNLKEGILKLDSVLRDLPKEIPVDDNANLNVTFVDDPFVSNSSIGFEISGLFTAGKMTPTPKHHNGNNLQSVVSCQDASKMLGISLDEIVFNSASVLYYDAEFVQWIVDKEAVPDQSLMNTAGWRFIVPQLYRKYPKDDMNMNITLSSPPVIRISEHKIDATIYADLIIDVLDADKAVPVVCISLVIRGSGSVKILSNNNLAGSVKLDDFTMSLKWSKIGNLYMSLIQPVMWTLIQTVFLPFANSHLGKGFPLPIIHGFTLDNAEIILSNSRIMVCSDVSYTDSLNLTRSIIPYQVDRLYNVLSRGI